MIDRKLLIAFIILIFSALGLIDMVRAETGYRCDSSFSEREWKEYSRQQLFKKLQDRHLDLNNESLLNAMITESYFDLMDGTDELNELNLIGYFYSHASFHLGRIARYRFWPRGDEIGISDKGLITGRSLRRILRINSSFASKKLMQYSESLYYHLSWPLTAVKKCGLESTLPLIEDQNLKDFFVGETMEDKFRSFVTYEQSYLQKTLYSDGWIAPMVKIGTIDEMRWIPFADEQPENYRQWCKRTNCGKTSFDLNVRIKFDTKTLLNEWRLLKQSGLSYRLRSSSAFKVNDHYLAISSR